MGAVLVKGKAVLAEGRQDEVYRSAFPEGLAAPDEVFPDEMSGDELYSEDAPPAPRAAEEALPAAPPRARRRFGGLMVLRLVVLMGVLALGLGLAALVLTGRTIHLPVWAVAEIETRLNRQIGASHLPGGSALSLGAVEVSVERDLVPRIVVRDIRLVESSGQSLISLPEVRVTLDGSSLLTGHLRPGSLRLSGARIAIARDEDGRIALSFGQLSGSPGPQSAAELLDALDRMFSSDALADLRLIEADALTLSLTDRRAGRVWEVGDGRLVVENGDSSLAAELSVTLLDGTTPAQALLAIDSSKADSSARLRVTVDRVASADLAAQASPLAFLGLVDAPISGQLTGALAADGSVARMEAQLSLAAGTLRTESKAKPVSFEAAGLSLRFDPQRNRVHLDDMAVESDSLRLKATGTIDLADASGQIAASGAMPSALIGQLDFSEVMVDPEGLFEEPVRFSDGALNLRVWLSPLRAEIGLLRLVENRDQLTLSGHFTATEDGPDVAMNVGLNQISTDRLIKLWPVSVVPKTRNWLAENVGQGQLESVDAALRLSPGTEPRFALDYEFSGAEVRFLRTLPPVQEGQGHATIEGTGYIVVLEGGHVTAPEGGEIGVTGSVFRVPDITQRPAQAEVRLLTDADLTATLSLLDQEPFHFISKAGRSVDLGEGRAVLVADLSFPLVPKLKTEDVQFDVSGRITGFRSDKLVPGQVVTSDDVAIKALPSGMTLSGEGRLGKVPFVARYEQPFGPDQAGKGKIHGTVELSDANLRSLGVALPEGWLRGTTRGEVDLALPKGAPVELTLRSDLRGAVVAVPPVSWSKPAGTAATLEVSARLSTPPVVERLSLTAPGFSAQGKLTVRPGGGLDKASFSRVRAGEWLDAPVEISGAGSGKPVGVSVTGGMVDLRKRPSGKEGEGATGNRIETQLDRLVVTSGIALTGFRGSFVLTKGGLDGGFSGAVNGRGRLTGVAIPTKAGTAVRVASEDAGTVMAASGIFAQGRGGKLDLVLQPRSTDSYYEGKATVTNLSVLDAPALAGLLSAVSVVGLLEQMNGQGILFNEGDAEFVVRPDGVEIRRGAAVGASLGLSFAGLYRTGTGVLDVQGTISPIYLLNGIGEIFTRKGEGMFGFNYRLTGTVNKPQVSVNPLSILTPGMFRDIFRRPPPVLGKGG